MSDKLYTFKENEWVVTGWAEGLMEAERKDEKGNNCSPRVLGATWFMAIVL